MTPLTRTTLALAAGLLLVEASPADSAPPSRPSKPARAGLDPLRVRDLALSAFEQLRQREIVKMLSAIASGSGMGPGEGWFGPGQGRYDWKWLARRCGAGATGRIPRKEFKGPAALFDRLDRDGDGVLTAADFDWSDRSSYVRRSRTIDGWASRLDSNSNGRISHAEWEEFFKKVARGKDHFNPEDLRDALLKMPPPRPGAKPDKGPTPEILLAGLFRGALGSFFEGPAVGDRAINFSLPTPDGKRTVALADALGKKPIVLIFGSFT